MKTRFILINTSHAGNVGAAARAMKTMRDASPKDGLMDSEQTRSYTAMLDQQMATHLSRRGVGLADLQVAVEGGGR